MVVDPTLPPLQLSPERDGPIAVKRVASSTVNFFISSAQMVYSEHTKEDIELELIDFSWVLYVFTEVLVVWICDERILCLSPLSKMHFDLMTICHEL